MPSICNSSSPFHGVLHHDYVDDQTNPYFYTIATCHAVALITFTVSTATGNLSQVDKLWSVLPSVYAWMCVIDARTRLMAWLSSLWSIRLTYNFHRRGGYSWPPWNGDEDYRWEVIRRGTLGGWWKLLSNRWALVVFNVVFISVYQNWLLLWIASPSLVAWSVAAKAMHCPNDTTASEEPSGADGYMENQTRLNFIDGIAASLFLLCVVVESIADNQQFSFQQRKREWKNSTDKAKFDCLTAKEYSDGFCQSGLFAYVRKPNYAAEQLLWFSYFLFSKAALYSYPTWSDCWNWSGGGFISLWILFQGSGWLTERISLSKYPDYKLYQKSVPLYVPKLSNLWCFCTGSDTKERGKEC